MENLRAVLVEVGKAPTDLTKWSGFTAPMVFRPNWKPLWQFGADPASGRAFHPEA